MKRHRHTPRAGRPKLREGEIDAEGAEPGKPLTPERRRPAVAALQASFGVSERRACAVVSQHRSTQHCVLRPPGDEELKLRRRLRAIARCHPCWGWKMAHRLLRREGFERRAPGNGHQGGARERAGPRLLLRVNRCAPPVPRGRWQGDATIAA